MEAGTQAGHPRNDDFNGAEQEGFGRFDFTIRNGKRWSTSSAFLKPVLEPVRNLTVETGALTQRIIVENDRATGVEVTLKAAKPVAASERNTRSDCLRRHRQLAAVAACFPESDRQMRWPSTASKRCMICRASAKTCRTMSIVSCPGSALKPVTLYGDLRADKLAWSLVDRNAVRQRHRHHVPLRSRRVHSSSHEGLAAPDIQLHFMPAMEKTANLHLPNPFQQKTANGSQSRLHAPRRTGQSGKPRRDHACKLGQSHRSRRALHANYLQSDFDLRTMISGIRMTREVIAQKSFDPISRQGAGTRSGGRK